jgi:hypothetical protein
MLKMTTVTRHEVDWHDFNDLVTETYGHEYEFAADVTCGNDSDHAYTVKKEPLDEYHQKRLDEFKATGKYGYLIGTLLTDLVNRELIPEGNYLISVSW